MDADMLQHVFQAFSQADRTIDRSRGGLGLGLALVKGLVELHDGFVEASSAGSGRGTEMTVRLPLSAATIAPTAAAPADGRLGAPRRILVVEDNRMAARSMEMFLSDSGHTVEIAHTGPTGIEVARRFRPEVVLCDIGLPELDGYEVARTLRQEQGNGLVLIAITGYGQQSDRRRARGAGFDNHLTKPVDLDELNRLLVRLQPAG